MAFLEELNRRGVIRTAALYIAVAWGGTEILVFLSEALLGEAVASPARKYLAILFVSGFPVALFLSWSRDLGLHARRVFGALVLAVVLVALLLWLLPGERMAPSRTVPSDGSIRSLAVLPLDDLSGREDQAFFAIGMTEALIAELSRVKDFRVISRTSVMGYAGTTRPLPEIAQELGVDAIVEGSVLRDGNRVRITAQLIEAASDHHLWADSFEGEMENILSLQNEAAKSMVRGIDASMSLAGLEDRKPERVVPEAYDEYLKALIQFLEARQNPDAAIAQARRVIELDPSFAPAYALLSELHGYLALATTMPHGNAYLQARQLARKAMELDPGHPYSRFAMARVHYQFEWDWNAAESEFERGVALDPNNSNGLAMYGSYRTLVHKDCEGGITLLESARDRDPFNAGMYFDLGVYNMHCRRFEESIRYFERTLELRSGFWWARLFIMWNHSFLGSHETAVQQCKALLSEHGEDFDPTLISACIWTFAQAGQMDVAEAQLSRLEDPSADIYVDPIFRSFALSAIGDWERALDALERALAQRSSNLIFLQTAPGWDPLREHPRFQAIIDQMNFPNS